jgi:flagellar basal body rod protein FlgC
MPARPRQRFRQVAHNIADAADFATRQGTVLRREEYDLPFSDAA